MTLENTLLQKLSDWHPAGDGRHTLAVTDEAAGWNVAVTADRQDQVGCVVWELALRRAAVAPATDAAVALRAWAERAAGRVKGLLEMLAVVEVDPTRGEALLRSNEPTQRGEAVAYYEVLLRGTPEAAVRRFKGGAGQRREQVAFALTHEVLARLAADLTADE